MNTNQKTKASKTNTSESDEEEALKTSKKK
jgi:hypothetical protein